ncbi:MAG: ABC transporter substrate-binding protein [Chloroflexi bacterium]|nr:ABC transporter substrate-binding protein [Chloroflexota bacterium]
MFGALGLAACTPAPAAAPTTAPTAAPAATKPAAAATTAPAVAASPAAAAASPAAAAASPVAKPAASPVASPSPVASDRTPPPFTGAAESIKYATTTGSATSAGVYIAQERGYFKDQGINLELVPFAGAADMVSSIATGQVDIANMDIGSGPINAMARNVAIRFVADGARCESGKCNSGLVVRKDLVDSGRFKTLADLKGLNYNALTPGSTINLFSLRTLEKAGLKASDVNILNLSFADILPAAVSKAVDASFNIEPFITVGSGQNVWVKIQDTSQILGPQQATVIAYSPPFASGKQDLGKRFMVAYLRGVRDFVDAFTTGKDRAQIVSIMTTATTLKDPALWNNVPQTFDTNGAIILDALKANQQWYVENGYVQTPINMDAAWDPQYVDYATGLIGKR